MTFRASASTTLCILLLACGDEAPATLTREQLMDPQACKSCHPTHYREWKASMHAYAAEDPIFRAMNALGQQETDGGMGDFCVQCHAPMALREGATRDGLNLDDVPEHLKGVTCYFCHNIESVEGDHNAQLTLAGDTTMRGAIRDPVRPSAHGVMSSRFMDGNNPESSRVCGACHDIVNGHGVHLERTFAEYQTSIFSADGDGFKSCTSCHMPSRKDVAAEDESSNVGFRPHVHSHLFTGVDVALTDWPDREAYARAVECGLADGLFFFEDTFSFDGLGNITVWVETNAGHNTPSGSAQDRRVWVELTAFGQDDEVLCTSGAVPDGEAVVTFDDEVPSRCRARPGIGPFRDIMFDANGEETHMFWRAAPSEASPDGFSRFTVRPQQQDSFAHGQEVSFAIQPDATGAWPARLRLRLRIRPMDHDVLEELIDEGLLDESIPGRIPTFTIPGGDRELLFKDNQYVWQPTPPRRLDCEAVACEFTPDAPKCN